jgi:hypothetical protein
MPYDILQWPATVYPGEVQAECPEAAEVIDVLIGQMRARGPSPDGYSVKNLGKRKGGLWQINLKVEKRQARILYAPYQGKIVLFRIHKKGSGAEQDRAYDLAMKRKSEYDQKQKTGCQSWWKSHTSLNRSFPKSFVIPATERDFFLQKHRRVLLRN